MIQLKEDIVVRNFEDGIGTSPHTGFEDIRNANITSLPGSVSMNFKLSAMSQPPTVSALAYTTDTATNIVTVASTTNWYNGMAIVLNTVVTSTGISTGRVYWIGNLTATTFKLYTSPSLAVGSLVDITGSNGSGTLTSYTMSAPLDKASFFIGTGAITRNYTFILDDTGKLWWIKNDGGTLTNNLVYLGNDTLTGTTGRAVVTFSSKIIVFRTSSVDYLPISAIESGVDLDSGSGWTYGFDTVSSVYQAKRPALVGQDNILYFGNDTRVGSFSSTLTKNVSALDLLDDDVESIGEAGANLLIGGSRDYVYPWNRTSESFYLPIIVPESKITKIVTANQLIFLFAGNRGNIYYTNGSTAELYKKVPDHITGVDEPYFTWLDAMAWRNQLYFSFAAFDNAGAAITTAGGVWAIDLKTNALRYSHQPSYGSYAGSVTVLAPNVLSSTPAGNGIYAGWSNTTYGVDVSSTSYFTSYATYIISKLEQVGTGLTTRTIGQVDITLDKPLISGEGIKVSYRKDRTSSFSTPVVFDFATQGGVQFINLTFPVTDAALFQSKIEMTGTSSTPYLKEVRFR